MNISRTIALASAALFAAGCAHEGRQARYDETLFPHSEAEASGERENGIPSSSAAAPVNSGGMDANAGPVKSRSESDNAIVSAVREALRRNAEFSPIMPDIQITANNGAVLLNGWVQSPAQKGQIGAIAQQANGVIAVNNQLQTLPAPPSQSTAGDNVPGNPVLSPTSRPAGAERIYPPDMPDSNVQTNGTNSTTH